MRAAASASGGAFLGGNAPSRGKLVLVVDDDPWIQQVLMLALEDEGYTVVVAGNGEEALALLERHQPSLIVLDWMMPRMNGNEFARELQRRRLRSEIPILLLTAAGSPTVKAAGIGADACLSKPFDLTEFLNQVRHLVAD
jgi:DNA-binding response OmpR family regulator